MRGKPALRAALVLHRGLIPARAGKTGWGPLVPGATWAHPRACGENTTSSPHKSCLATSSPRVRGKPRAPGGTSFASRLIPACAGKTSSRASSPPSGRAHPRVCEENVIAGFIAAVRAGSSPRVRGKRWRRSCRRRRGRLIPARAGKTGDDAADRVERGAHPRACGENNKRSSSNRTLSGSSPRVRGKPDSPNLGDITAGLIPACAGKTRRGWARASGSAAHPRVCGENLARLRSKAADAGLIPACAGKTSRRSSLTGCCRAHPRVCGENVKKKLVDWVLSGSSPRVRGKLHRVAQAHQRRGLIPACAGKTHDNRIPLVVTEAHPRVCGENQVITTACAQLPGSSPRVRGKLGRSGGLSLSPGLIPACAGKTGGNPQGSAKDRAHPRVCGENGGEHVGVFVAEGSSPRVRGKRHIDTRVRVGGGLIPACAGKTSMLVQPRDERGAHPRVCGEN